MAHEFKIGDQVRFIPKPTCEHKKTCVGHRVDGGFVCAVNSLEVRKEGVDSVVFGTSNSHKCPDCVHPFDFQPKEVDVNEYILEVYDKTADAKIVIKWFGSSFDPKNRFQCIAFKSLSIEILAEARRLEAEEQKKLEKK